MEKEDGMGFSFFYYSSWVGCLLRKCIKKLVVNVKIILWLILLIFKKILFAKCFIIYKSP